MSFTCSEFPGQSFNSLEELRDLRVARDKAISDMYKPVIVQAHLEKKLNVK